MSTRASPPPATCPTISAWAPRKAGYPKTVFSRWRARSSVFAFTEIAGRDLARVADRRAERARLARRRLAEEFELAAVPPRISPIHPALGDEPVNRDIPILRMDGRHLRQLVADADHHRPLRQAGEGPVEEAGAVAQPIA